MFVCCVCVLTFFCLVYCYSLSFLFPPTPHNCNTCAFDNLLGVPATTATRTTTNNHRQCHSIDKHTNTHTHTQKCIPLGSNKATTTLGFVKRASSRVTHAHTHMPTQPKKKKDAKKKHTRTKTILRTCTSWNSTHTHTHTRTHRWDHPDSA